MGEDQLSFLALFGAWFIATGAGLWPPLAVPIFLLSPAAVGQAFVRVATKGYQNGSLMHHLGISLFRFGVALLFCVVVGVGTGLLMGMSRTAQAILDPIIEITRPIPELAILPLLVTWFVIEEITKFVVVVLALFPMMSISAMQAVREVGQRKVQAAYTLGCHPCRGVPPGAAVGVGMRVQAGCEAAGLIVRAIGDRIAFTPPLIIDEPEITAMCERFGHGLDAAWAGMHAA